MRRTPTINQINDRLRSSPVMQFYFDLDEHNGRLRDNWRNRSFLFKRPEWVGEAVSLTISGNFTYGAAVREFSLITGVKNDYYQTTRQVFYEMERPDGRQMGFQLRLKLGFSGVWIEVETNFKPICGDQYQVRYEVRSGKRFGELDVQDYFEKRILSKYLYGPGIFRDIQLAYNCTKAETKEKYKKWLEDQKNSKWIPDEWKAWKQLFKRRLNILISKDISEKNLAGIFKKFNRQKKRMNLFNNPSVFEMSEQYLHEYDDDIHMEKFVSDYFENNYPKNAIFI